MKRGKFKEWVIKKLNEWISDYPKPCKNCGRLMMSEKDDCGGTGICYDC